MTDQEALELSMKIAMRNPSHKQRLEMLLEGNRYKEPHPLNSEWIYPPEPWEKVAKIASHLCQADALNLAPWQRFPSDPSVDAFGDDGSIQVAREDGRCRD